MRFDPGDGSRYPGSSEKAEDDHSDEREGEQPGIPVSGAAFQDPRHGIYLSGRFAASKGRIVAGSAKSQGGGDQNPCGAVDADGSSADAEDNPLQVLSGDELGRSSGPDGQKSNSG